MAKAQFETERINKKNRNRDIVNVRREKQNYEPYV